MWAGPVGPWVGPGGQSVGQGQLGGPSSGWHAGYGHVTTEKGNTSKRIACSSSPSPDLNHVKASSQLLNAGRMNDEE